MHEGACIPSSQDLLNAEGRMDLYTFEASAKANARKITHQCDADINVEKCIMQAQIIKHQFKTMPNKLQKRELF